MDDSAILTLFKERSEQAVAVCQQQYGAYCRKIIAQIVGSQEDTEECLNDVWMKVWNSIPPYEPTHLRLYLGQVARNTAVSLLRKETAQKRGGRQTAAVLEELEECLPAPSADILDRMALKTAWNAFLPTLSSVERRVFLQRYFYMTEPREIAQQNGLSYDNVRKILSRTRAKLKTYLEKEGICV